MLRSVWNMMHGQNADVIEKFGIAREEVVVIRWGSVLMLTRLRRVTSSVGPGNGRYIRMHIPRCRDQQLFIEMLVTTADRAFIVAFDTAWIVILHAPA
jgi:hypothetical protein